MSTSGSSKSDVQALALRVRKNYFAALRNFAGERAPLVEQRSYKRWDVATGGRDSVWVCVASKPVDFPSECVPWAVFDNWAGSSPPFPNVLVSDWARTVTAGWWSLRPQYVSNLLRSDISVFDLARGSLYSRDSSMAVVLALTNRQFQLSSLFRYSMLCRVGREDVAAIYRPAAVNQFNITPSIYVEYWCDILPRDMVEDHGA